MNIKRKDCPMINDILIRKEPYSVAYVNVMDEFQFHALLHRSAEQMELKTANLAYDFAK